MDLAYDGWFRQNDFETVFRHVNYSRPDYYSMDIEAFPEWEAWAAVGFKSANFVERKLPAESDSAASQRLATEWLGGAVAAAKRAHPSVNTYLYDIWARFDNGKQPHRPS